jgi:hypothetical protein
MKKISLYVMLVLSLRTPVEASVNMEAFTDIKQMLREKIMAQSVYNSLLLRHIDKSFIQNNDRAENLIENPDKIIRSLEVMEQKKLLEKKVSVTPWSDTYWPIAEGMVAARYNDPEMRFAAWSDYRSYFLSHPADGLIKEGKFDFLAPSEKYDYLMGILENGLTDYSWSQGEMYNNQYHEVESWMGLCHGWSVAAMMMPNPVKKVSVKMNDEQSLTFYPSDIKALGTLLWAQSEFPTRFVGGRCDAKDPAEDPMGRAKDPNCLDDNPGTWHMAIVNQIGQFDRSFVMDATYDYQVWNQPVYGYKYTYLNMKNNLRVNTLKEAIVSVEDWKKDPRKKVRSPGTKYIVGINMTVEYVREAIPNKLENQPSLFSSVTYDYDLELDAEKRIIGGEWYSRQHPDFLWVADAEAFPKTAGDQLASKLNLNKIVQEIKEAAAVNAKRGIPYGPFVKELFKQSAQL